LGLIKLKFNQYEEHSIITTKDYGATASFSLKALFSASSLHRALFAYF
jgi:hypothetical protein